MADNALITDHLDLVTRLARKLHLTPHSRVWDDAIQAGRMGLIDAASRYRAETGVSFRTYAREYVLGEIKDAMSAEPVVRPSRYTRASGATAVPVEIDEAYAQRRTPAALVDLGLEDDLLAGIDQRRRIANLRLAMRALPPDEGAAVEAICSGESVAQYAGRNGLGMRTAFYRLAAGKELLRQHSADSAENNGQPDG